MKKNLYNTLNKYLHRKWELELFSYIALLGVLVSLAIFIDSNYPSIWARALVSTLSFSTLFPLFKFPSILQGIKIKYLLKDILHHESKEFKNSSDFKTEKIYSEINKYFINNNTYPKEYLNNFITIYYNDVELKCKLGELVALKKSYEQKFDYHTEFEFYLFPRIVILYLFSAKFEIGSRPKDSIYGKFIEEILDIKLSKYSTSQQDFIDDLVSTLNSYFIDTDFKSYEDFINTGKFFFGDDFHSDLDSTFLENDSILVAEKYLNFFYTLNQTFDIDLDKVDTKNRKYLNSIIEDTTKLREQTNIMYSELEKVKFKSKVNGMNSLKIEIDKHNKIFKKIDYLKPYKEQLTKIESNLQYINKFSNKYLIE